MGYIYILINPSFPQYVKIGYAKDVNQRLDELNRSSAVPFAFRIYATYEVDSALSDKKLHSILDKLDPELRSKEEIDGKKRVREFYAMTPEDAYAILESIANISGTIDRLKKVKPEVHEIENEKVAAENQKAVRRGSFRSGECGIPIGAEHIYVDGPSIKIMVIDDRHIQYGNETIPPSAPWQSASKVLTILFRALSISSITEKFLTTCATD